MRSPPDRHAGALSPRDIAAAGLCIGCGVCVHAAAGGRMTLDAYGQYKPAGDPVWMARRSPGLAAICPFSPHAADETELGTALFPSAPNTDPRLGRFIAAYVGFAAENGYRDRGSSGGMVSWAAAELMRTGRVDGVLHVAPRDEPGAPRFAYRISRCADALETGAKSRYYPVELSEVLGELRATPGRYAVVGVPCFIKAVNLLRRTDPLIAQRVVHTLGLVCGHMKSARMAESFAWQMGTELPEVRRIDYRTKEPGRPANWYVAELGLRDGSVRQKHWWDMVDGDWGAGFFQNAACNACDDVMAETADICFGDAWVEPHASDWRGTNIVVVRSPELYQLIEVGRADGRLALDPVDADFVAGTQGAGLRQRREGLAYRLTWRRRGLRPVKRVAPRAASLPIRRRMIYRMRAGTSAWSHRVFWLARTLRTPRLYLVWARLTLAAYSGLTYSRGRFGGVVDRVLGDGTRGG